MNPKSYFDSAWQRCESIKVIHSYLDVKVTSVLSLDELLRAEWAARVSALDLYVHELVAQNMIRIFLGKLPVSDGFNRFKCSADTLIRIKNAGEMDSAVNAFDLEVRTILGRMTFQTPDDIADGIRLVSNCELWKSISINRGSKKKDAEFNSKMIKRSLSLIVKRRNSIVHEGDLEPSFPRIARQISKEDLLQVKNEIYEIVCAIDAIVWST